MAQTDISVSQHYLRHLNPPGSLHNPDISSVFSFFSSSATRPPRILMTQKQIKGITTKLTVSAQRPAMTSKPSYLLICRWCWITMFFSWIVSSRAVARDFRSEMDWGVTGKLQPFSSDSNSSFTAFTSVFTVNSRQSSPWKMEKIDRTWTLIIFFKFSNLV